MTKDNNQKKTALTPVSDKMAVITQPQMKGTFVFADGTKADNAMLIGAEEGIIPLLDKAGQIQHVDKIELLKAVAADSKEQEKEKGIIMNKRYYEPVSPDEIDMATLQILFSTLLEEFDKLVKKIAFSVEGTKYEEIERMVNEVFRNFSPKISIPEILKKMDIDRPTSANKIKAVLEKIFQYRGIAGVIHMKDHNGKEYDIIRPVMLFTEYDSHDNTISFTSPYMNVAIIQIYLNRLKVQMDGIVEHYKNGQPKLTPAFSYTPKPTLAKARNKSAVEIVEQLLPLIATAGDANPWHISYSTLIDRCPVFKKKLENYGPTNSQSTLLRRTFKSVWKLMRNDTHLDEKYEDIRYPDVTPNMGSLESGADDAVINIYHGPKKKKHKKS